MPILTCPSLFPPYTQVNTTSHQFWPHFRASQRSRYHISKQSDTARAYDNDPGIHFYWFSLPFLNIYVANSTVLFFTHSFHFHPNFIIKSKHGAQTVCVRGFQFPAPIRYACCIEWNVRMKINSKRTNNEQQQQQHRTNQNQQNEKNSHHIQNGGPQMLVQFSLPQATVTRCPLSRRMKSVMLRSPADFWLTGFLCFDEAI